MTYNQVVKELETVLSEHPMIHEVLFSSPVEWINRNHVPSYPVSCYEINSGFLNAGREQIFRVVIWFLDKSGVEAEFEPDTISDMHGVAYDILAKLRQQFNEYLISTNVQFNVVSEKFEDYLSGVRIEFDFSIVRKYGACDVPE